MPKQLPTRLPKQLREEPIESVRAARPKASRLLFAFVWLLLAAAFWSCHTNDSGDVFSVTFKLDSSRVGKFDSVHVDIYNGKAPQAGDTTKPVQSVTVKVSKSTTEITIELAGNVQKDFSAVVTGYDSTGIVYRNLHTVNGFASPDTSLPAVLLVSRIKVDDITLSVGETRRPVIVLTPDNAGDKRIILASKDTSLVKIVKGDSAKGDSLHGVAPGKATVSATTADGSISVNFTATVAPIRVTGFAADSILQIKVGDTVTPAVTVKPDNATDKDFSIESGDTTILVSLGKSIKGVKAGSVKWILVSHDGGVKDTLSAEVRVAVTGLKASDITVEAGDVFPPALQFQPDGATRKGYTLSSKDSSIVAVQGDSLVAKAIGNTKVTAVSKDGSFSADFNVTVNKKVFHVVGVSAADVRGVIGDTLSPNLTWNPANATEQGVMLTAQDTSLVDIKNGKLVPKALGKTQINFTTVDGGIKDSFNLSIEFPVFKTDILPITSLKCAPCHSPGQTFNWQDSAQLVNKGAIAIDRLTRPDTAVGKMPLVGAPNGPLGSRDLTVLLSWLAKVAIPLTGVAVKDTEVNLGDTVAPNIVFSPANASNKNLTLTTQDSSVVAVVGSLLVPGAVGSTTINLVTDEKSLTAHFKVTVDVPSFQKNVLPITTAKCTPCHGPDQVFNWQDSVALVSDGANALDRLQRDPNAPGKMPLKGAPNGDLTPQQLKVLLAWLNSKVVPLKGFTVPDDSVVLGGTKSPAIVWTPANATNKSFVLTSFDTSKVTIVGDQFFGHAIGSASVGVTALDGNISKSFNVKVLPIKVDSINVHDTGAVVNDTVVPVVNFSPGNATTQTFTIALVKPSSTIISILPGNKIVGIALGKDTVEATSTDGSKKARFSFNVGPVVPTALAAADTNGVIGNLITPRLIWTPSAVTNKGFTLSIPPADTGVAAVRGTQILCKAVGTVNIVTVASTADATKTAQFKFTVGPVSVISLSVAATTTNIGLAVAPAITWNPTNATNKNFTLSIAAADASKVAVTGSGATVTASHLGLFSVTTTSQDGSHTAPWSVNVIRTSFTTNLKGITTAKCGACHFPPGTASQPNWQDSATVVLDSALIRNRITLPLTTSGHMPPNGQPQLTADTLNTILNWISQN